MERERYMRIADINQRNKMLDAMAHNTILAQDNPYPIRLNRLQLMQGMKLEKPYREGLWEIQRVFTNGQILVRHNAVHKNDRDHVEVWGRRHLCRVPNLE